MDPLMYTQMSILNAFKGNFLLAECNKISGKCFSHTPLGTGYRSCDRKAVICFCCTSPLKVTVFSFSGGGSWLGCTLPPAAGCQKWKPLDTPSTQRPFSNAVVNPHWGESSDKQTLFLLQGCPLTDGLTTFQFIGFCQKKQGNKPP